MKYQAVGYYKNSDNPSSPQVTQFCAQIEQTRFEEVKKAKDICYIAFGLEEKFQLVLDNFNEWEIEQMKLAQTYMLWRTTNHDATEHRRLLDRRLTNVLTAFRLYVDQTDYEISNVFGSKSNELEHIKKFKNSLYDKHFGYRFLEELRNHVQHCALPVQMITYREVLEHEKNNHVRYSIVPRMTLDDFEGLGRFKPRILEEVKLLGGKIDLRQPTREYISCLVVLHKELRKTFTSVVSSSRTYYLDAVKHYTTTGIYQLEHPRLKRIDDNGTVIEQIDLITRDFEIHDALHKRISNVTDISKSFASSEL